MALSIVYSLLRTSSLVFVNNDFFPFILIPEFCSPLSFSSNSDLCSFMCHIMFIMSFSLFEMVVLICFMAHISGMFHSL